MRFGSNSKEWTEQEVRQFMDDFDPDNFDSNNVFRGDVEIETIDLDDLREDRCPTCNTAWENTDLVRN